jgi:hypothetical protein
MLVVHRPHMQRIEAAKQALYDTEWEISYLARELDKWRHTASLSFASLYVGPIVFIVLGVATAIWGIFQVPVATMDNGGNWAAGPIIGGLFVAALSIACIIDNKGEFEAAPGLVSKHEADLADARARAVVEAAAIKTETAEHERRRRLPDAWAAAAGLLAEDSVRRIEDGDYAADDLIGLKLRSLTEDHDAAFWDDLEKRIGSGQTRRLRDAREALSASSKAS